MTGFSVPFNLVDWPKVVNSTAMLSESIGNI